MFASPTAPALASRILKTEPINWRRLRFIQQEDFKEFSPAAEAKLKASMVANQFVQAFNVWEDPEGTTWCLDGRHRVKMLEQLSAEGVGVPHLLPATFVACTSRQEAAKLVLIYSSFYARTTEQGLADFVALNALVLAELAGEIDLPNIDLANLLPLPAAGLDVAQAKASLAERFGVPPFSVLDARQGYWQARKNQWLAQGIASAAGRGEALTFAESARPPAFYELRNSMRAAAGGVDPSWEQVNAEAARRGMVSDAVEGTSIFDPVLCELAYRWFCPSQGIVLDPFAGGSVRGLVAAALGYHYVGIDLRPEQVQANDAQREAVSSTLPGVGSASWAIGDSRELTQILESIGFLEPVDFVFSCPPYADLEVYSDDPADLSTMKYPAFVAVYREIIAKAVARLKPNRFACFVVGEVRDPKGLYRNFVGDTIAAFEAAGARYYNELILVTQAGSLPIRVGKQFQTGRKVGKTHQNVLVFYKGDPKAIRAEFGEVDMALDENAHAPPSLTPT